MNEPTKIHDVHDYKRCRHCHHFVFHEDKERVGVCRLNTPEYHDMTFEEVEESDPFSGYPPVRPNDNHCADWTGITPDPDLRVGGYALVTADCFDSEHSLVVAADDRRFFRILGCPSPGFYEIVSTNTHRQEFTNGTWKATGIPYSDRARQHAIVPGVKLTAIHHRFNKGDFAELNRKILVRLPFDPESRAQQLEVGTPIQVKEVIAERGTYNFWYFLKYNEEESKLNRILTHEEVPDSALTVVESDKYFQLH